MAGPATMPLLRAGKTLKGAKPQERRCVRRLACQAPGSWETTGLKQRLGAWASSEEEPKPTRGFLGNFNVCPGGPTRENPEAQPVTVKGMRGAPNQWWR
jgi:hypothetical protein